ncbi:MAG: transporter substrate-binding domain-containing protein [Clostridium sp.]|nr:transporter substrate-binding domain-containing protein [Clostridium sp.]
MKPVKTRRLLKKRFFTACIALLIITALAFPAAAATEKPVVLKVPFPEVPGFTMIDEKGHRYGLVVDYLNEIAKYTGWTYEYTDTTGLDMVDDFLSGEYDLMGGTYYIESLEKYFAYPDYSCGYTKSVLLARQDDNTIRGYDYKDLDGKTIGVVQRAVEHVRRLEEYLALNGLHCTIKNYSPDDVTAGQLDRDLTDGIIDVKLGNITDDTGEFRAVAYIDAQPHYIVAHPDNPELLEQLNWALGKILSANPDFPTQLYQKYFDATSVRSLLLTDEERKYVQEKGIVTVAVPHYFHPFYCADTEDGGHDGIIPELLQKISEQYGLEFSYVFADSYAQTLQLVMEGKADMAGFFYDDLHVDAQGKLVASAHYSTLNDLIVRNKSVTYPGENLTCGLLEGRQLPEYAKASRVKYYKTVYDVLCAVNTGDVDFACGLAAHMEQVMQANIFNNVVPVSQSESRTELRFALPSPVDSDLLTILNKGINSLSEQEKMAIVDHNFVSIGNSSTSIRRFIEGNPITAVFVIGAFSMLMITVIAVISRMRVQAANMQKAVAKVEAKSKAKSEFFSRMSHEIRTPMNAIVGLTTLLFMKDDIPEDAKEILTKLNTSSHYLLGLINDILDMSRIDSGMLQIARENFSLSLVLDEIDSIMQSQALRKQIRLSCNVNINHPNLVGDSIRLKQVLMNLLSNAIKFTPAGGQVCLTVEETQAAATAASYLFRVSDTGVGIAEEDLSRIFESFEQVGSNHSRSQGTGLGLPISLNIVECMGGKLQVESEPGKGSEFYFSITMPFGEPPKAPEPQILENTFDGVRFLLVEDNLLNAEIATDILSLEGAQVELAADGVQAVDQFLQSEPGHFDVILMDMQMPNMNGLEATKAIRASGHPDARSIPIIALTANTLQEDRNMAGDAGMNDFLTKPLDISQIHTILQKWLRREN